MPVVDLKLIDIVAKLISLIVLCATPVSQASTNKSIKTHQQSLTTSSNELQRALFADAEDALERGQTVKFDSLLEKLREHPLVNYLHRDRLIHELSSTPTSSDLHRKIRNFLKQNNNQVVARKLRFYWLGYLADTKQNQRFSEFYQPQRSFKLRCHNLYLQLSDGQPLADLSPKIEQLWLTGQSLPKQCDPLFLAWKLKGELTEARVWKRMLLAANNNQFQLVKYLSRMLSDNAKPSGEWLEKVTRNPSRLNHKPPAQLSPMYSQTVVFRGLRKLAWKEPEDAIKLWKQHYARLKLSETQTTQLQRAIGLSLAINGSIKARNWLESVELVNDHSVKQWLLSSRLSLSDWSEIHDFTQTQLESESSDKWLFWHATAIRKLGNAMQAELLLSTLAKERSYYGFLAASSLNRPLKLNQAKAEVTAQELAELTQVSSARRAKALLDLGRYSEARSEWNHLMRSIPQSKYLAAAHLAHQWEWNHQSILAFAKSKTLDDIEKRFPLYRTEQFRAAASLHDIPMSWAFAITRQESAFKKDATSSAGAQGLMQLKPSTARRVARLKLKRSPLAKLSSQTIARRKILHQPDLNIELGIAHLKQMLDYYDGNHVLATAAYNAGSARVDAWLKDNDIAHSITWIEQIPFKETREYVKNVLTYQEIYSELIDDSHGFIRNINNMTIPTHSKTSPQVSAR